MSLSSVVSGVGLSIAVVVCTGCNHASTSGTTPDASANSALDASTQDQDAQELQRVDAEALVHQDAASADASSNADAGDAGLGHGRSLGCGTPQQGTGSYDARATQAGGLNRVYYFYVPTDYDATRAYPVIFRFHGFGGSGMSGGLEIEQDTDGGALIVSPNGVLEADKKNLSWNPSNEVADIALFDALLAWVADSYCVDLDRIYAYGFSAGGGMAQLLACRRGDVLRAVGTIAAVNRTTGETCQGQTAGYLLYASNDQAVPLTDGVAVRDHLLQQDQCTSASEPAGSSCIRYTGCGSDPVVYCVTSQPAASAHDPGGAAVALPIWQFFSALPSGD